MKYIVTKDENGKEEIFIFSKAINHDCFAEAIRRIRDQSHGRWRRIDREPIAAGFVGGANGWTCFGRSETLKLNSRGCLDEMLIDGNG